VVYRASWRIVLLFHLPNHWEVRLPPILLASQLAEYAGSADLSKNDARVDAEVELADQLWHFSDWLAYIVGDGCTHRSPSPCISSAGCCKAP
jgi:hypothetical protein